MILTRLLRCEAEQCRIELIKQIDVLEPHNKSCPNPSHWNGSSVWHTRHTLHWCQTNCGVLFSWDV